jgi:hypothetical protein
MEETMEIVKLINNWKTLGALASIVILLQILVKLLKIKMMDDLFIKYRIKWTKPYIAVTLGALIGGLSTYSTEANLIQSIVAGMLAATASVGWNEIINKIQPEKRQQ